MRFSAKKERVFKRFTAFFVTILLITSFSLTAMAKINKDKIDNAFIETTVTTLSRMLPYGDDALPLSEYKSENFFSGTGFNPAQSKEARWSLGSAEKILTPDNLLEKKYYAGGGFDASLFKVFGHIKSFFEYLFKGNMNATKYYAEKIKLCFESSKRMISNKLNCVIKQKYNDMYVRAISIDDGTGRGATAVAVIDCIGISNSDVRKIRKRVIEKVGNKDAFSGITVAATHCHSCIDTQGIWTNTIEKISGNFIKSLLHIGTPEQGYDTEYMEFLYEKTAEAIINSYNNMEQGSLSFASKNLACINNEYFYLKKRDTENGQTVNEINRFVFTPDNNSSAPTMIVNVPAHPYYTSIATPDHPQSKGDGLSGDFVYYMGKIICEAGYNYLFFNGSIANVYTYSCSSEVMNESSEQRDKEMQIYGKEMGKIALSLTKTEEEIKADGILYNAEEEAIIKEKTEKYYGSYHPWYENWICEEDTVLDPVLNTVYKEIFIPVTNPVMELAGKLLLTSNQVLYNGKDCYIVSEIGYVMLGNKVKIVLMPGEVFPDLQCGGGMLTAEKSYSGTDFGYPCIREIFGDDTIVFGLANDAIGYIVPENDYMLCFDFGEHYHELFCTGKYTASLLIKELLQIKDEISSP